MTTTDDFFTELTLNEIYPNVDILKMLARVDTKNPEYDSENLMRSSEQEKIIKLLNAIDKDTHSDVITYHLKNYDVGRLYAKNSKGHEMITYQAMWKTIRRLVADSKLSEIDIVNCQVNIVNQLLIKHTQCKSLPLEKYIKNREGLLASVIKENNVTRDQAKNLFVIIIFGGTYKTWLKKHKLDETKLPTQDVYDFQSEFERIRNRTALSNFPNYEKFLNYSETKYAKDIEQWINTEVSKRGERPLKNIFGSALGIYLQNEERLIMGHVYEYIVKCGKTPVALVHDAFIIKETDEFDRESLTQFVKERTGYDLSFKHEVISPTEEDLEFVNKIKPFLLEKPKILTPIVYNKQEEDETYESIKREFEKKNMKFHALAEYGMVPDDGEFQSVKQSEFKVSHQELGWIYRTQTEVNGHIKFTDKRKSFIDKWFLDPNKRVYNSYDFLPPPMKCPSNVFNTWNGFPIEKDNIEAKDPERILELIRVLSNNHDETYKYVLDWLAQIVQEPGRKSGTMLVFKSKQGAGKGTLVEILKLIMNGYVGETSNPQRDLFGNHANAHVGKLLCSIDEVRSSDVFKFLGQLKNLVTSTTTQYNEKCVKAVEVHHFCRFIFTTNASIPITIEDGDGDRRTVLIESDNKFCKDAVFWKKFYTEVVHDKAIIKGFFELLRTRDITKVDWMKFPKTSLREEIIKASLHPIIFWLDNHIQQEMTKDIESISSAHIHKLYETYCEQNNIKLRFANPTSFGINLKDHIPLWDDSKSNTQPTEYGGIRKRRTKTSRYYEINRKAVFEWLKMKDYTTYDSLQQMRINHDYDDL